MSSIKCWLNLHDWYCIKVFHYGDTSYMQENEKGAPSTTATFSCLNCGEIKIKSFYGSGFISIDEFNTRRK